jgi:hypothetical protein
MLIVQKFHSIHEIDPEFIPNIELLLQEEIPHFDSLVAQHDQAPADEVFTYFLFFGPTQNTPIGMAQLSLKQIPSKKFLPWWKKLMFWKKDHLQWKQATWKVAYTGLGTGVFDQRFSRSGKEKIFQLINEYHSRPDVMANNFLSIKDVAEQQIPWKDASTWNKESYVLEPLSKSSKTYQDYLASLDPEIAKQIKTSWKDLHKNSEIKLGDYPSIADAPANLPIEASVLERWKKYGAAVLTFERDDSILGCLLFMSGKNGNVFFEPFLFEPDGDPVVDEELYTQYALLKFFEMPQAKKFHLMKFGQKLVFEDKSDMLFLQNQGFGTKTLSEQFYSRIKDLKRPL